MAYYARPKLYKGVEVSFQALGGQSKTIRITLDLHPRITDKIERINL